MPLDRDQHPDDEQLALYADALEGAAEGPLLDHVLECARCREIVTEARIGLARLALSTPTPPELQAHARARRWAFSRRPDEEQGDAAAEDIAEVAGRDRDATLETETLPEDPPVTPRDDG